MHLLVIVELYQRHKYVFDYICISLYACIFMHLFIHYILYFGAVRIRDFLCGLHPKLLSICFLLYVSFNLSPRLFNAFTG